MNAFNKMVTLTMVGMLCLVVAFGFGRSKAFAQDWPPYYFAGPSGGSGGGSFADIDELAPAGPPPQFHIENIQLWVKKSNNQIASFRIDGMGWQSDWHGMGPGPNAFDYTINKFSLNPDERLVGIDGSYGDLVTSMRFRVKSLSTGVERVSDFYGHFQGPGVYSYTAPLGCEIVAFWGRSGRAIDAIGTIVKCDN